MPAERNTSGAFAVLLSVTTVQKATKPHILRFLCVQTRNLQVSIVERRSAADILVYIQGLRSIIVESELFLRSQLAPHKEHSKLYIFFWYQPQL